jgi:NAD(P)-dependent dehydrogenase (short-subunit alcohol dehydrogenase family)
MNMADDACYVVTGATGGVGSEVAKRLLARGESVVVTGRDATKLATWTSTHERAVAACVDLSQPEALRVLTETITDRFAGVKGFVHAAGMDCAAPLAMTSPEEAMRLFAVHAGFALSFLGWVGRRKNHVPGTSCVLISSLAAHEGAKGHAAYAAAKGAVEGLLKSAAAELASGGIRVNAVVAGIVETAMSRNWLKRLTPEQRAALEATYPFGFGTAEDVADAIDFFLSPASRWITGQTLVCDGGHTVA